MSLRERRRRLVAEDGSADDADGEVPLRIAGESGDSGKAAYAAAARADRRPRVHEFVPSRLSTLALVTAGCLVLVGMLAAVHVWSGVIAGTLALDEAATASLTLSGARNLSQWFASTVLGGASLLALFIYSLRRHRVDDYHGRYRVWIVAAMSLLAISLVETTDMASVAKSLCRYTADVSGLTETNIWPIAAATLLALFGVRLLFEVRRSRISAALLVLVATALVSSAMIQGGWFAGIEASQAILIARATWLAGYVLLLTTLLSYARHVLMEIEGLVRVGPTKPKRRKKKPASTPKAKDTDDEKPALQLRSDAAASSKPAATAKPQAPAGKAVASANSGSGSPLGQHLSRAERRKQHREQRMAS